MKDRYKKFWMNDNLKNIAKVTSLYQGEWNIREYLRKLKARLECNSVLDFGCGYGRVFPCFNDCPTSYFGVDLNPVAIAKARKLFPQYKNRFCEVDTNSSYARADMILAFTVFLHIDDDTLIDTLKRLYVSCGKNIVIIETLGREWRPEFQSNYGLPLYNREKEDYLELMSMCGFDFVEEDKKPNPHYLKQDRYKNNNCYTNILVFRKVSV